MHATLDQIRADNARYMFHPMADPKAVKAQPPLIVERAEGVYVWDIDGRRYLDTVASLWNVNVGHNRPEIKRAIAYGRYMVKEMIGVVQLKKYRTMKKRYVPDD